MFVCFSYEGAYSELFVLFIGLLGEKLGLKKGCFKMQVSFLIRYGEAKRSGGDFHWKDSLLQFPRGGDTPRHAGPHREAQGQSGTMSGEKAWAGISSVVSMKKARQGRVSQIRIG